MKKSRKVTKAVITAAGYGTRFLPATKNVPKELLPLIDMPVLEYITQECVDAGIKDIIIVTRYGNNAIEDYLDSSKELESMLERKGKKDYLKKIRNVYEKANFVFVRQSRNLPYGTATPMYVVRNLINDDEAFAFLYGDDVFMNHGKPAIGELIKTYERVKWSDAVIAAYKLSAEEVKKYGLLKYHEEKGEKIFDEVIEKPETVDGGEWLARPGRFIYHSSIFNYFDKNDVQTNPRGEWELTDVENRFKKEHKIILQEISSIWYPTGQPLDMMRSMIQIALRRPEYKEEMQKFINEISST